MQKIIGLDIGSYSIKAVEILNHFKSYEISNFYETPIPQIDEISPGKIIPTCLEQIFQENALKADRIITAMPGQYISSRIIPFSFSDPSKIEAAVYAEVEDVVPFNFEDMIVDHQILGSSAGQTVALVVMTKKVFLASFLEHLQRINIDPKLVDVDSLAFYNLCPYLKMEEGKSYGIIDVGHEKTSICLVRDRVLKMFRSINLGGRYITDFLARDLQVSFAEAQRIKHEVSAVISEKGTIGEKLSEQEKRIAERITVASNSIVKELGRTLYAFKTWEKSPVEKIFLSGGTSQLRDFDHYLEEQLEISCEHSKLDDSNLKIAPELMSKVSTMAQGLAIGLRAVNSAKRHSQINLRKGEYAYVQDYGNLFRVSNKIFKSVSLLFALLVISYVLKYFMFNQQITALQNVYRTEFLNDFPDLKKKYASDQILFDKLRRDAVNLLKEKAGSQKKAVEDFLALNKDSGALIVLERMSQKIPKEVKVDVVEFRFSGQADGTGEVKLRVEADSFDTISKFKEALKSVKEFDEIIEKSSDSKPGSESKIATIETNYKPLK